MTVLAWGSTLAAIAVLLALDWVWLGRGGGPVRLRDAGAWSLLYIAAALAFGVALGGLAGWDLAAQYFAGYAVEKSLSIDNLFVFVIIMESFAVPATAQPKALTLGIVFALALRTGLIVLGAALLASFSVMFLVFGLALIATAVALARRGAHAPRDRENRLVTAARRVLPLSPEYQGARVMSRRDGARVFTPMALVLLAIATTDVLFALDSIPAVFGVTRHAFIVFAANAFALLGLRALYFLVSGLLARLVHLTRGLAFILGFIGLKLVLEFAHHLHPGVPEISTGVSLVVVAAALAITVAASLRSAARRGGDGVGHAYEARQSASGA